MGKSVGGELGVDLGFETPWCPAASRNRLGGARGGLAGWLGLCCGGGGLDRGMFWGTLLWCCSSRFEPLDHSHVSPLPWLATCEALLVPELGAALCFWNEI